MHALLTDVTGVAIPVRLWDGTLLGPGDASFRVDLRAPWSLRALLLPPTDLAAGEAYVHGDVDVEGDLVSALHAVARARARTTSWWDRARLAALLVHLPRPPRRDRARAAALTGRRHTIDRDRRAVRFHYDLGNDFFRLFLDADLVYSCAYFDDPAEPLEVAQRRKLDLVCRKLRLRPGDRLLDIGCGWGSLVILAGRRYGVRALGVTVSESQADLARRRVAEADLGARVEIRVADYREVEGSFDAVASIGMFEHVGPDRLGEYFAHAYRLTAAGGRFLNHGITTGQRQAVRDLARDRDNFVARYVFPDGGLVPAWMAARHLEEAGFEVVDVEQLRPHYALTLRRWVARLEQHHDRAVAAASETDYRIWRAYMAGSVVGFETGDLGVVQVLGSKQAELPLGRRWMLPTDAQRSVPA